MKPQFTEETITDAKRLVRGELYLRARFYLRARDKIHNARWNVLIVAGGAPAGEVRAIRELMPKARIVAVDRVPACLDAAIEAGVDEVVQCDLFDFVDAPITARGTRPTPLPPLAIQQQGPFDIINLDLCGPANDAMRDLIRVYTPRTRQDAGVFLNTFSIGRDVVEALITHHGPSDDRRVSALPKAVHMRLRYILNSSHCYRVDMVAAYRGRRAPMCSYLIAPITLWAKPIAFLAVEPGDYEAAVLDYDPARLYDCSQARFDAIKRKRNARKAVATRERRQLRLIQKAPLLLPPAVIDALPFEEE